MKSRINKNDEILLTVSLDELLFLQDVCLDYSGMRLISHHKLTNAARLYRDLTEATKKYEQSTPRPATRTNSKH